MSAVQLALGEEAFQAAWEAGEKLSLDEAVALALEESEGDPKGMLPPAS